MIEHFKRHFFKFLYIFTVVMRDKKLSQKSKIILEVQNNKRVPVGESPAPSAVNGYIKFGDPADVSCVITHPVLF